MLQLGLSAVLTDVAGELTNTQQQCTVFGVGIATALVGTLTFSSLGQAPWVISATSVGLFQAPTRLTSSWFSYSNPVDAGKAFIAWRPS